MIHTNEFVLLVSPKGKRYLRKLDPADTLHTSDGTLPMAEVAEAGYGATVRTHMGREYRILRPTIYELVKGLKRQTQIIYPKEIGYIVMRLGVGPGMTVFESGSGSGSLTMALAWFVGPQGKVHTFERREEFMKLCERNLAWAGLDDGRVELHNRDIADGFDMDGADALFLDVRTPWEYLDQAACALNPGAPIGFLLPTTNQVCNLLDSMAAAPFDEVEVVEIMLRRYKPVADRFRPEDRMVAHTGFLVFARHCQPAPECDRDIPPENEPLPDGG